MAFLDNSILTIDAILTSKGREYLASNNKEGFQVEYFALGDDEINYDLWNPIHPLGSDYYGIVIENMPILEASTDPNFNLRSKLITLPKTSTTITRLVDITVNTQGNPWLYFANGPMPGTQAVIVPTLNGGGNNNTLGYTLYFDPRYFVVWSDGKVAQMTNRTLDPGFLGDTQINTPNTSSYVATVGFENFTIQMRNNSIYQSLRPNVPIAIPVYLEGNEIGGRITILIWVQRRFLFNQ